MQIIVVYLCNQLTTYNLESFFQRSLTSLTLLTLLLHVLWRHIVYTRCIACLIYNSLYQIASTINVIVEFLKITTAKADDYRSIMSVGQHKSSQ